MTTRNSALRHLPVWLMLAFAIIVLSLIWNELSRRHQQNHQEQFALESQRITTKISERMRACVQILRGGAGFFSGSESVGRTEWRQYFEKLDLGNSYPGIQGVGFSLGIQPEELQAHERATRRQGFPQYSVKPAGPREFYTSIIYLEPFSGRNLRAFGYDMYSEPVRRAAMDYARDSGDAAFSGKVKLVQETRTDVQAGVLVYYPVYHSEMATSSVAERRAALHGWVYSPYRMNDLLNAVVKEDLKNLRLEVFDGITPATDNLMFDSHPQLKPEKSAGLSPVILPLPLPGHQWTLRYTALPGFVDTRNFTSPPLFTFGAILLILTLLVVLSWAFINTRRRAEAIADELTITLRASHDELEKRVAERTQELAQLNTRLQQDIVARTEAEDALRALNETLEQCVSEEVAKNREKDLLMIQQSRLAAMGEMIGNIAHQWRQPLNALALLLSNIKDAFQFNELDAEYLDQSVANGTRLIHKMSSTINDFRDFFSPDKAMRAFSAVDQIHEAIALVEASFKHSNILIRLDAPEDIQLMGFPNEYSQVLLNLLSNAKDAITHAGLAEGHVDIRVRRDADMGVVSIRDNGGGIPDEILDKIFEPYFSTKHMGTGIGLYMSKMIIERNMYGSIRAHNMAEGAEFSITTPLAGEGA